MKTNTIRFKICVLYVAIIGLFLIAFQWLLYRDFLKTQERTFDSRLRAKADEIRDAISSYVGILGAGEHNFPPAAQRTVNFASALPQDIPVPTPFDASWNRTAQKLGLDKDYLVILDAQNNVLAKSNNVNKDVLASLRKFTAAGNAASFQKLSLGTASWRVVTLPFNYDSHQKYKIQVGTSYLPMDHALRERLLFILFGIPAILLAASLIARLFIARILDPVVEISKSARKITQENLNVRIEPQHADEEIKHLADSLNDMIARLNDAFIFIKEFSLLVAHELKTPIAVVRGESEVTLLKARDAQEYQRVLGIILEESKNMLRTIDDLLLLAKLDYRFETPALERMDLAEFLREITQECNILGSAKGITVQGDIPLEPIWIQGDKVHLERLFFNLFTNALKFTSPGGRVDISAGTSGKKAVVSVADTGAGISPEDLLNIFQKFYHTRRTDSHAAYGFGLGLNIVQSIVNLHQGTISAESQLGKGTTFSMEFPLS